MCLIAGILFAGIIIIRVSGRCRVASTTSCVVFEPVPSLDPAPSLSSGGGSFGTEAGGGGLPPPDRGSTYMLNGHPSGSTLAPGAGFQH